MGVLAESVMHMNLLTHIDVHVNLFLYPCQFVCVLI